jgi:hypothetical protein
MTRPCIFLISDIHNLKDFCSLGFRTGLPSLTVAVFDLVDGEPSKGCEISVGGGLTALGFTAAAFLGGLTAFTFTIC